MPYMITVPGAPSRRSSAGLLRLMLIAGLSCQFMSPAFAQDQTDTAKLRQLYTDEWSWRQSQFARVSDDDQSGATADHLPRVDAAAQHERLRYWTDDLSRLKALDRSKLPPEEAVNYEVFKEVLEANVADLAFRTYEAPFNSDSNFWSNLTPRAESFPTAEQYRHYLGRMRDIPRYFDEQIENMRAGLARGFTIPRITLTGRDNTVVPFTRPEVEQNPFYAAFRQIPATVPPAEQAALQAEARTVIRERVVPAYAKLLAFLRTEYFPQARTTIAAEALPDGKAFYRSQLRQFTTLDLTPEELHALGLREVARIDSEMDRTMQQAGFTGTRAAFIAFLRSDPRFYPKTPLQLLSFAAYVTKRVDGRLKDFFVTLPRYRFAIRPVPDLIAPYYTAARGGLDACYLNTYNLGARPLYQLTAVTLHECNPGHALQYAFWHEQTERPAFRRVDYFAVFGEGWGLYSESLGVELGVYDTPYENFGRLSLESWRACRLVVDTGIHHMGWTRQRAIDFLLEHTALAPADIEIEVDRYISWPGQAVSYKVGELTIKRLRKQAEEALGPKFDVRAFNSTVLSLGSVPMSVLEARIGKYIADGGKPPQEADH